LDAAEVLVERAPLEHGDEVDLLSVVAVDALGHRVRVVDVVDALDDLVAVRVGELEDLAVLVDDDDPPPLLRRVQQQQLKVARCGSVISRPGVVGTRAR